MGALRRFQCQRKLSLDAAGRWLENPASFPLHCAIAQAEEYFNAPFFHNSIVEL
jgi:hypothetical protein